MTRSGRIASTCIAAVGLGLSALLRPAPKLIWNASASVPIGLYAVLPAGTLHVNELLVVMPPEPLATFLNERRYLPNGVPLLKHVLALPGQTVCRSDRTITVDGVAMGDALDRDHLSRPLPVWHGCRVVTGGDVFLMNRQSEDPSTAVISARFLPPPSSAGPIHSGPTRSTDHATILLPARRYAATTSAPSLLLPGPVPRRAQPQRRHGAGAARAPPFGSASRRYCWLSSALLMPNLSSPSSATSPRRPIQSSPSSQKRRSALAFRRRGYAPSCRSKASASCELCRPRGPWA